MFDIATYTRRIRNYIASSRLDDDLRKKRRLWHQFTSSICVIQDTECAIDAYARTPGSNLGEKYLLTYGILQVLVVQQDAIQHLCQALSIEIKKNPTLNEIREIRNYAIGHPSSVRARKPAGAPVASTYIGQMTISKEGFHLIRAFENGNKNLEYINIVELIEKQREISTRTLEHVWVTIQKQKRPQQQ